MALERITLYFSEVCVGSIERESMYTPNKTERVWSSDVLERKPAEAARGYGVPPPSSTTVRVPGRTRRF